jgi:hypothetical protein
MASSLHARALVRVTAPARVHASRVSFAFMIVASVACVAALACARIGAAPAPSIDAMSLAAAPRSSPVVDDAADRVSAPALRVSYEALARELTERCGPANTERMDNMTMKAAVSEAATCKRRWADAAVERAVVAATIDDPARGRAIAASEAALTKWVDVACWLSEEASWVDFEEGTRDDGTMRSYAWMACLDATAVERHFFARALIENDASAIAARIESRQEIGEKTARTLAEMKDRADALLTAPIPAPNPSDPYPAILDHDARAELATKIDEVITRAPELARDACAIAPAVTRKLGGETACVAKTTRWILAQATFGMLDDDR